MESIKEILVKNQPAPSQTSRANGVCATCGNMAILPHRLCPDCLRKADEQLKLTKRQEAEKLLAEAITSQECSWVVDDSNMPGKFLDKTFDNFDSKLQPKAFEMVKNLQWEWDGDDIPPKSLVLLSPGVYGIGKTHLVCALMNNIFKTSEKAQLDKFLNIRRFSCPAYFISENHLLRRIRNTYNQHGDSETEEDIYKALEKFRLLIIDDVGKVKPRDLNFLQGVYFNIIDQRYTDSQPILLTTNLNLSELETHIGGACADRIREMAGKNGIITMSGKSYRHS